jgi:hypothetical protein
LESVGGNLSDFLAEGQPFLTIVPTAQASFAGNILNTTSGQMPANSANVTAVGNLRFDAPESGADTTWTNGAGNRQWNQPSNWTSGLPDVNIAATIGDDAIDGPLVAAGIHAAADSLVVGDSSSTSDRLDITDGTLAVTRWLVLGYDNSNTGTLAIAPARLRSAVTFSSVSGAPATLN